ncbi:MAG TPA: peptide-methionine (S)-S-oxide reductase MsrA [Casimicrobiaceae bacterium]|nr:peptide-methionine (S)-S-oxide reductase MsrA [Casimicrobiaceae bacterium]
MLKDVLRTIAVSTAALLVVGFASAAGAQATPKGAVATFAGGCFWCVEEAFDQVPGVLTTTSGYMGGKQANPTYEQVSTGMTGHTEVVQVTYDPAKVSYEKLLDTFWRNIDPTVGDRQFCDAGSQYRAEIFVHNDDQRKAAEASKAAVQKSKPFKAPIVTPITAASAFYAAEDYHQDYYVKNPARYKFYKTGCGREARLTQLWGKK